jgi:hypothetical protein
MVRLAALVLLAALACRTSPGFGGDSMDLDALFEAAHKEGRVGVARKSEEVDARPAAPGEVVVTYIANEGKETQSRPAVAGDMVVRNRCEPTGNEEYLVSASVFPQRYEGPLGPEEEEGGWRPYRPLGPELLYFILRPEDGTFFFWAPWSEEMVARPGDAIVRNPADPKDTYRVAAASFACTYEVVKAPASAQ